MHYPVQHYSLDRLTPTFDFVPCAVPKLVDQIQGVQWQPRENAIGLFYFCQGKMICKAHDGNVKWQKEISHELVDTPELEFLLTEELIVANLSDGFHVFSATNGEDIAHIPMTKAYVNDGLVLYCPRS